MRLVVLNTDAEDFPITAAIHDECSALGLEVIEVEGHDPDAIASAGAACDGLLVYRAVVDDALLARLPRCRVVARCGTGYEHIDVAAAHRRGIVVTYVPDFCAEEMSDLVLFFVLYFSRGLHVLSEGTKHHQWVTLREMPELRRLVGRTVSIFGFGSTGRRTVEKARCLGMDVMVWTRTPRDEAITGLGGRSATFEEACAGEFLSLHPPLTRDTSRLFGPAQFELMKSDAILINTARGGLIDTDALVDALQADRLGGAGLDVTEPEPLPPDHPLWNFRNVVITSHTGSLSIEALDSAVRTAVIDTAAVLHGDPPRYPAPHR